MTILKWHNSERLFPDYEAAKSWAVTCLTVDGVKWIIESNGIMFYCPLTPPRP